MTTVSYDTLANFYDGTPAPAPAEAPVVGNRTPVKQLLLKQKRSSGQYSVEPHVHRQFEQLIICECGSGSITLEDGCHTFQGPAILVIPAYTVHALSFGETNERWVVSVAKGCFQEIMARAAEFAEIFSRGRCIRFATHEREYLEIKHVLDKLDWEQRRSERCQEIVTEALLIDVLVSILRKIQVTEARAIDAAASDVDVYRNFNKLVEEHHTENWDLQKFADALCVTVPRLRTVCHAVSGESPIRIINTRIVQEAKRYLTHTNLSVTEIACQLGFEDASYFSRFFKSRCGQTPSVYKAGKNGTRPPS